MARNTITRWLTAGVQAVIVFAVMTGAMTVAHAAGNSQILADGMCIVNTSVWGVENRKNTLSLTQAIELANDGTKCTREIRLDVDVKMAGPIEIARPGLILNGNGHKLDGTYWKGSSTACAITVASSASSGIETTGVVLEDLEITGIGSGVSDSSGEGSSTSGTGTTTPRDGICLMSSGANQIINVQISGIAGDAIVFGPESTFNLVDELSSATQVKGMGVRDMASEVGDWNIMRPTARVMSAEGSNQIKVDSNGIVEWLKDASGNLLNYRGSIINDSDPDERNHDNVFGVSVAGSGQLLYSARAASVQITSVSDASLNRGQWTIEGFVMANTPDTGGASVACKSATTDTSINVIAVFGYRGNNVEFLGYVGKKYGFGIQQDGTFKFRFDTRSCNPTDAKCHPEFVGINKVVLVPMFYGPDEAGISGIVGQVVQIRGRPHTFELREAYTSCSDGGGPTHTGQFGDGSSLFGQFSSKSDCQSEYSVSQPTFSDPERDSDGDGIPDFYEMSIRRAVASDGSIRWIFAPDLGLCSCEDYDNILSCWHYADSDSDGIMDGREGYPDLTVLYQLYDGQCDDQTSCSGATRYTQGIYANVTAWDITNVAGFLDSDAQNPALSKPTPDIHSDDSDGDGLHDGWEDRSRLFRNDCKKDPVTGQNIVDEDGRCAERTAKEFIYEIGALDNAPFHGLECNLDSNEWGGSIGGGDSDVADVGVAYGVFVYGGSCEDALTYPKRISAFGQPGFKYCEDSRIVKLECRNISVADKANFNGTFNKSSGETNAKDADTDNDCVCDGAGSGCKALDYPDGSTHPQASNCKEFCLDGQCHNNIDIMTRPEWLADQCPTDKPRFTNECWECIEDEFLIDMVRNPAAQPYMTWEGGDNYRNPELLKDTQGVPLLFNIETTINHGGGQITILDHETVMAICGDLDGDGIPNCVERWDGKCPGEQSGDTQYLNPYDPDSDDDGLMDGAVACRSNATGDGPDVCPFTKMGGGEDDRFAEGSNLYSCSPYDVYKTGVYAGATNILAYYLDRDCDGIPDGIEDRNQDGRITKMTSNEGSLDNIWKTETDPLSRDTDGDGLSDTKEILHGWPMFTNPADIDTDGDGLTDMEEDRDCPGCLPDERWISVAVENTDNCERALFKDTNPLKKDTDGDGLSDAIEIQGVAFYGPEFVAALMRLGQAAFLATDGLIDVISDPTAPDSDNDGLLDSEEYNGVLQYNSSNPCMKDSDGDGVHDFEDDCPLNPDRSCVAADSAIGPDSDGDGLPDEREIALGTDPYNKDTDGDGLFDGEEDSNRNGIWEPWLGESDPRVADTDGDGLTDGYERRYGTDPTNNDTDGDCIPDGVEDANQNGIWDPSETNALSSDTDGDGLPDGWLNGLGEDRNCNGVVDTDAEGRRLETDPRMPDSDLDGILDYDEMLDGGYFNINNIGQATTGGSGCQLAPQATSAGAVNGLIAMVMGLIPMITLRMRRVFRLRREK